MPRFLTLIIVGILGALFSAVSLTLRPPALPLELEVELLNKVVKYDRNYGARVHDGTVVVFILYRDGVSDSERVARQLDNVLARPAAWGTLSVERVLMPYASATALSQLVVEKKPAIIVLAPGVSSDGAAVAQALANADVLTVSTSSEGVAEGVVLGFDLVGGRPQMLLQLEQARRQRVEFKAEVLKLMKLVP